MFCFLGGDGHFLHGKFTEGDKSFKKCWVKINVFLITFAKVQVLLRNLEKAGDGHACRPVFRSFKNLCWPFSGLKLSYVSTWSFHATTNKTYDTYHVVRSLIYCSSSIPIGVSYPGTLQTKRADSGKMPAELLRGTENDISTMAARSTCDPSDSQKSLARTDWQ